MNMGAMFNNTGLSEINLPNTFNTSKVVAADSMFRLDTNLNSLILPSGFNINSNYTNTNLMFYGDSIHCLKIYGVNNKWRNNIDLLNKLYRKIPNGTYNFSPHNFSQNNVGTFVDANIINSVDPKYDPNLFLANDDNTLHFNFV